MGNSRIKKQTGTDRNRSDQISGYKKLIHIEIHTRISSIKKKMVIYRNEQEHTGTDGTR